MLKAVILAGAFTIVAGAVAAEPMRDITERPASQCDGWFRGSACPDGTAAISGFTGKGRDGTGWSGNAAGDGGPSAVSRNPDFPRTSNTKRSSLRGEAYRLATAEQTGVDNGAVPRS